MTKKWIALLATVGASLVVCVPAAICGAITAIART